MSNTSIGRGPASGGNENHDGDPLHKTLGEAVKQERPAGNEVLEDEQPKDIEPPPDATPARPPAP